MKPVELEIFLQDGLSPGLKKAGQTVARFSDESKKELKEITESLKLQKSYVSGMEKEYARIDRSRALPLGGVIGLAADSAHQVAVLILQDIEGGRGGSRSAALAACAPGFGKREDPSSREAEERKPD